MIANSVADLSQDFFGSVMGVGSDALVGIEIEPIGTGQIARTFKAHLHWAHDHAHLPSRVIIKLAGDEPDLRDPERRISTYRREAGFYKEFGSVDGLPVPRCFFAGADCSGRFTLVMAESPGTTGDQLAGCSERVAQRIVDAAATIHSTTWGFDRRTKELDWLTTGENHLVEVARRNERYSSLLAGFLDRYRTRVDPLCLAVAEELEGKLEWIDGQLLLPHCLVHNDFRLDNLIIDESSPQLQVTVVDWQTIGGGSGAVDVAYAIGSGLKTSDRRHHEFALVGRYISELRRLGIEVDRAEVEHDYRLGSASGLVMAVIASQVVRRTSRGDEMFAVMAERHALQMIDLGLLFELEHAS